MRSSVAALDAAIPWLGQARQLVQEDELKGLAADLRQAVPSLVRLNKRLVPFLSQVRGLSSCTNRVLVPFVEDEIPSIEEGNSGHSVREQINRSFVGLAGESRTNDANTPLFHVQGVAPVKLTTGRVEPASPPNPSLPPRAPPGRAVRDPAAAEPGRARRLGARPALHAVGDGAVKLAIRKHWRDFLAVLGVFVLGVAVAVYILSQQDFRFPLVEEKPKRIAIELENAQAVQPGQGQTVRVAGVEVGRIADVTLEEGVAVVELEVLKEHEDLIREDATALLRPKTALKDMFVEVSPGSGRVLDEGERISVANTLPDVDPDEIYEALDEDTRPYLKLLVSGAGKGLDGRGDELGEVFRRFEPLHRDLARVMRATAARRDALKRLIHRYGLLMTHVGRRPEELQRLVSASGAVFDALASEDQNISASVARLPGALRASESALNEVREFAPVLRTSLESLRPPIRKLDETNAALTPFLRETTPILRDEIRPFVRAARPFTDDLRLAARDLSKATPDLTRHLRGAEPLLQHRRVQPGRRGGPRGQVDRGAARARGGLPLLARVDRAERRVAVLERRRPGSVAPGHDLRRPGGGDPGDHRHGRGRDRGRRSRRARGPGRRGPRRHRAGPGRGQPDRGHPRLAVRLVQLQRAAGAARRRGCRRCRRAARAVPRADSRRCPSLP